MKSLKLIKSFKSMNRNKIETLSLHAAYNSVNQGHFIFKFA